MPPSSQGAANLPQILRSETCRKLDNSPGKIERILAPVDVDSLPGLLCGQFSACLQFYLSVVICVEQFWKIPSGEKVWKIHQPHI